MISILWNPVFTVGMSLYAITGHVDAYTLAAQADSQGVPRTVSWAVAWEESRGGRRGNDYLGPGRIVADTATIDGVVTVRRHRICRELGRYQINPCTWRSSDPRCTLRRISARYADNVYCGTKNIRNKYLECGNWHCAPRRHNGRGPLAELYGKRIDQYVGRVHLLLLPK